MIFRTLLASVFILALTLHQSPAQQPQPLPQPPPQQIQVPAPDQIAVNILGEVNRPARIILQKGATLLDAIASAGGFTRTANPSRVILIHKSAGEKPDSVHIDLKPILNGVAKDVPLRDGDTVNVGVSMF
jgi:protein involved in polysaccharide export with SLBB domain